MKTNDMLGTSDTTTYFAAKPADETASILLAKSKSFYNVLEANFYLEKLSRMWRV
jgi:hypothetical protein